MLRLIDIKDGITVVHDRSKKEYKVVNSHAQLKVDDGKWTPAVTYEEKDGDYWDHQLYVRDTATFMANFSLPEQSEE